MDYADDIAQSWTRNFKKLRRFCPYCKQAFDTSGGLIVHVQKAHLEGLKKEEPMAKRKCDHLNVETRGISGVSMAVCKDCGDQVDPMDFERKEVANTAVPLPPPGPADRPTDGLTRVFDTIIPDLITFPGLDKPFFPLFGAKPGDLVVILRKKA